jgi:5-methylcytosine-specific restriction protein A
MSKLKEITPKQHLRLMDLVKEAGVDVSNWANCKGGAANPKYCYEWSFIESGKVVVFNLWHDQMEESNGEIITRKLNIRDFAGKRKGPEKRRGLEMDKAIQTALIEKLPIRIIVLGGRRRNINNSAEKPSKVSKRLLDPMPWSVTAYNPRTGDCTLTRVIHQFVDQFSIRQESGQQPERRDVSGQSFIRSPLIRENVLLRASGKCEWCGERGFVTASGGVFLETHHVISLCDGGFDTESNVAALCPNHHREAHHGANRNEMRKELLARIQRKIRLDPPAVTPQNRLAQNECHGQVRV